jgi:hypothetical protein
MDGFDRTGKPCRGADPVFGFPARLSVTLEPKTGSDPLRKIPTPTFGIGDIDVRTRLFRHESRLSVVEIDG